MHAHAFNRTRMQEKARAINPNWEAKAKQRLAQRLEAEAEWIRSLYDMGAFPRHCTAAANRLSAFAPTIIESRVQRATGSEICGSEPPRVHFGTEARGTYMQYY